VYACADDTGNFPLNFGSGAMSIHTLAFKHGRVHGLIYVTVCMFCETAYWTPRPDVLLIVERIHKCPKMLQASGE
jgi:hypothetical protein